jgi:hypothetical protein
MNAFLGLMLIYMSLKSSRVLLTLAALTQMLLLRRANLACFQMAVAQEDEDKPESEQGIKQMDLMRWYLEEQTTKGLLQGETEAEEEMTLLFKVRMLTLALAKGT